MAATNRLQDPGAAALMAIFCAVGAVLGLALTVFLVHLDLDYSSQASAYNSAPNPNRIGDNNVAVVVNGRPLGVTVAKPLESITTTEIGTVDYLPSSRTLLEVRDAEGRVLCATA